MALVRIHHIAKAGARLLCRLLRKTPLLALGGLREEKSLRGGRRLSTITCAPALLSCAKANMFLDAVARGPQLVAMLPFLNPWQTSKEGIKFCSLLLRDVSGRLVRVLAEQEVHNLRVG